MNLLVRLLRLSGLSIDIHEVQRIRIEEPLKSGAEPVVSSTTRSSGKGVLGRAAALMPHTR
jgi:hypothetical protein